MKNLVLILFSFIIGQQVFAQLRFIERYEIASEMNDPLFEMIDSEAGLVSFRTLPKKGLNLRRTFQYFISQSPLNSVDGLVEFSVKEGYDMLGYDIDKNQLSVLFTKGYVTNSDKYILQVDLETKKGVEFVVDNVLE